MEADPLGIPSDSGGMRWDLLLSQPPRGTRLTARLAMPSRSSDVFIAIDAAERRYVLTRVLGGEALVAPERPIRGLSIQAVEMTLDAATTQRFIEIACLDESGHAALDIVTSEIVDALDVGATGDRMTLIRGVLEKWRRFWSGLGSVVLAKEHQLGLFGELWFLTHWLVPALGTHMAVSMWRGPVGARNDFEKQGLAVEVKTSGRVDGSHHIASLEQLMAPEGASLLLFSLLVREEGGGLVSIPQVLAELREILRRDYSALSQFDSMLAATGYDDAQEGEYAKLRLRVRGQSLYKVTTGFPRLIPSSLSGGQPPGVTDVAYQLRLDTAGDWLVAQSSEDARSLLRELGGV